MGPKWPRGPIELLVASVALSVAGGCGDAELPASSEPEAFVTYLETVVPDLLEEFDVPGASVALVDEGVVVMVAGFGLADTSTGVEVSAETVFRAASISKPVTAWGVMRLVESGMVDLDASANGYMSRWQIPDGQFDGDATTVRQLLAHTGGLSLSYVEFSDPAASLPTLEGALSGAGGRDPVAVVTQPGATWAYSGGGYMALELLVEDTTGKPFAAWVEDELLGPLGMNRSTFDQARSIDDLASGHDADGNPVDRYVYVGVGAAGLFTTAEDLGRFVAAAMTGQDGAVELVLRPDTIAEMLRPVITTDETGIEQGLGYWIDRRSETIIVGHSGSDVGWNAKVLLAPSRTAGIAILTNSDNGAALHTELGCRWAAWETEQSISDVCP